MVVGCETWVWVILLVASVLIGWVGWLLMLRSSSFGLRGKDVEVGVGNNRELIE